MHNTSSGAAHSVESDYFEGTLNPAISTCLPYDSTCLLFADSYAIIYNDPYVPILQSSRFSLSFA